MVFTSRFRQHTCVCEENWELGLQVPFQTSLDTDRVHSLLAAGCFGNAVWSAMLEQLGLIGTIRDEEQSPEEPDSESDQEVS